VKPHRSLFVALVAGAITISLVGCNSAGTSVTNPVDLSPPQAPTNLHSTTDQNISREWLIWDLSASANVAGYQIYSTSSTGGSATLVASVDATTSDFILPIVGTETTEYYRVRAVGTNSVPSAFTSTLGVDRSSWDGNPTSGIPGKGTEGSY
jgi:fibronectin type 3 domain-containing protein